jgi:hypothetical protein
MTSCLHEPGSTTSYEAFGGGSGVMTAICKNCSIPMRREKSGGTWRGWTPSTPLLPATKRAERLFVIEEEFLG